MAKAFTADQIRTALKDSDVVDAFEHLMRMPQGTTFEPRTPGGRAFEAWCTAVGEALCDDSERFVERCEYLTDTLADEVDPELLLDPVWHPEGFDGPTDNTVELVSAAAILAWDEWREMRGEEAQGAADEAAFDRARDAGRV